MNGACEIGKCDICGKEDVALDRTYFKYPVKCDCHEPYHFEIVHHCKDCIPIIPRLTATYLVNAKGERYRTLLFGIQPNEIIGKYR